VAKFTVARRFDRRARELLNEAKGRGEPVYGSKPWYCSASIIESGAKVVFIGANPGGGPQSEDDDRRLGYLTRPYNDPQYNAWLDDEHWEDGGQHQGRTIEAFDVLFGSEGLDILRGAACFNVVPLRTVGVDKLVHATWDKGVDWTIAVLEHVAPNVVVCNGNGSSGRSAWNVFVDPRFAITAIEETQVFGTYRLKRGRIARGKLAGAEVIGLPHLARMKSIPKLRAAARRLGFPSRALDL
jgi:hypothetical protein